MGHPFSFAPTVLIRTPQAHLLLFARRLSTMPLGYPFLMSPEAWWAARGRCSLIGAFRNWIELHRYRYG